MPRSVASDLGLRCLPMSNKKTLGLYGHTVFYFVYVSKCACVMEVSKTAKIKNQYNQGPNLTQDTTWESDKITIRHHKQEPRGQLFPSR